MRSCHLQPSPESVQILFQCSSCLRPKVQRSRPELCILRCYRNSTCIAAPRGLRIATRLWTFIDHSRLFQLDAPMSDWFKSLPSALDLIAYATKVWTQRIYRPTSKVPPPSSNKRSWRDKSDSIDPDINKSGRS